MIKRKGFLLTVLLSILFCFIFPTFFLGDLSLAQAQSPNSVGSKPSATSSVMTSPNSVEKNTTQTSPTIQPVVTTVYKFIDKSTNPVAINDLIVVEVSNFKNYYQQIICENKLPCNAKIALNLDGRRIPGINSEPIEFKQNTGVLRFRLLRDKVNNEIWSDLIGSADPRNLFSPRKTLLNISLATGEDATAIATGYEDFRLLRFRWWHLLFWVGLLILALRFLVRDNLDNLLRETGSGKPNSRPYSLSRCQMLWWLCWVIAAYVFIYMTTGNVDTINDTVLGFLGVGSLTTLGAVAIDSNEVSKMIDKHESQGFWYDLLNSRYQNGPGLHRLQLILWTMILTIVFVVSVYSKLAMPELSITMLALQGVTAGTYLGFKFPENQQGVKEQRKKNARNVANNDNPKNIAGEPDPELENPPNNQNTDNVA